MIYFCYDSVDNHTILTTFHFVIILTKVIETLSVEKAVGRQQTMQVYLSNGNITQLITEKNGTKVSNLITEKKNWKS